MQQPDLHREGYGIFVRCCGLSAATSARELVGTIETLDRILFDQINKKKEDFYPNPYGGAIYRRHIEEAMEAARALVTCLSASGISAAIGVAWGRFERTTNVHDWNAAALPLNEAARLAFSDAAIGRVLVSPHVKNKAGVRAEFGPELLCVVKGKHYRYHAIESADYQQRLSGALVLTNPDMFERNIVLWDIVKYSSKDTDEQADLSHALALSATTVLHTFGAKQGDYSPAGDGGFAVFDSGLKAVGFAKALGKYATSRDITIRTGINQGEVAFTERGPVGPGVLRADAISAQAPRNGIAILADVWRNLDKITRNDWRPTEIAPDILTLEPAQAAPLAVRSRAHVTIPPLPANYVERSEALASLRSALLAPTGGPAIALTALEGMGGIGKTVLARALFKDDVVRKAFPDGMVWITVGREPTYDSTATLREITRVLGSSSDETVAPEILYRATIANNAALIVLDDIWSKADLDPFLAESPRSRFLFTTRDASIARFTGAREHRVDLLDAPEGRELLALWAGVEVSQLPHVASDILRECGSLPLAISTVGALLRGAVPDEWADTAKLLHNADLAAIEEQLPPGQQSFFRAIDVSVKALPPETQSRYEKLAVLLDDMLAPLPFLETIWSVGEADARRIGRRLADRSLAYRDEDGGIRLHDLQLDYVRARYGWGDALALIHGAVRLSSHVIEKNPREFASQVVGRLLPYRNAPAIQQFIDEIAAGAPAPWLRPLQPALHPPGTPLLRTLEGHSASVEGVAVTADGKRAVSASADHTLKVWDLDTGRALRTLEGHSASVNGVAVTPDGKRAVSASADHTLKVWDLDTGRPLRTLEGHSASVNGVAVTPDGMRAVSAARDKTLRVWALDTGRELRTLEGHSDSVHGVVATPDGNRVVSASWDYTLKVWDLDTGRPLRTLEGHSSYVSSVMLADDRRAVSASEDNTLKVWDLDTGRTLRTLEGHSSSVSGVAMTPDGNRAVSGSWDTTLKVWNLDTGRPLRTPEDHTARVSGVAVTPDAKRAVSASGDYTLKVWDLDTGRALRTLEGHFTRVSGVAVTPDGEQVISAAWDHTLKVWDMDTGRALRSLVGHSLPVSGVAVTPDGKQVVSASWDHTLKVWDLDAGRALRTLEGHSEIVFCVAVTPDGKRAVSASGDHTLKVWDLGTGRALRTLEGHSEIVFCVAVTPDGKRAVSASGDHTLKVWDLDRGRALRTLEGHAWSVNGVAVTPNGKRAVSASGDRMLKVWDLDNGRPIATFHCDARARCCVFADQRRIVAGDQVGRVYILSLEEPDAR